uniref:Uncharacterized protein n=1 Tax=Tetraselmis sp. GSL018 TaxID=582737 RepID=A0A061RTZ0_9CHLO
MEGVQDSLSRVPEQTSRLGDGEVKVKEVRFRKILDSPPRPPQCVEGYCGCLLASSVRLLRFHSKQ